MYPKVVNLQLVTQNGILIAVKRDDLPAYDFHKVDEIRTTNFASGVRVPRLTGLIESHTGIVGFLMDYIPPYHHHLEYILRCTKASLGANDSQPDGSPLPPVTISKVQRVKWSRQIEETLAALHSKNIIWGDAKTANILIDKATNDAWVVDFGGGNTMGRIDRELHGSVEGDEQALARIEKELAENWFFGEDCH